MRDRTAQSGFTLIEALAAIVILSVAVPPALWALKESALNRAAPVQASRAAWLAAEKLEDIIADRHSASRGFTYLTGANYPAEGSVTGFAAYTRSVAFAQTGADLVSAGTGYITATVTVSWVDRLGVTRSLEVSTVLTDY